MGFRVTRTVHADVGHFLCGGEPLRDGDLDCVIVGDDRPAGSETEKVAVEAEAPFHLVEQGDGPAPAEAWVSYFRLAVEPLWL